jgi:type IV pilus assembly protein PilM
MITPLVDAALGAKLEPLGIDLSPFAVVRAVGRGDERLDLETPGEEAVVDIGAHVTAICVHDRGVTRFVRFLPSGGRDVTIAISRGLGIDEELAEALKRGDAVVAPEGEAPVVLPSHEDVSRLALGRAGSFVDEIRSSLEFYAAQVPNAKIARVVVTGGGSRLEGLLQLFGERIPVPVDPGRVLERVKSELDLSAEAMAEAETVLPVAVGLALRERT